MSQFWFPEFQIYSSALTNDTVKSNKSEISISWDVLFLYWVTVWCANGTVVTPVFFFCFTIPLTDNVDP